MKQKLFKKLDKRNTGFNHWNYYVNRSVRNTITYPSLYERQQLFFKWREWCWQTWGPSKELEDWLEDTKQDKTPTSHNEHWCFQNTDYATRIYLRSDKELSLFLLKWHDYS